MQCCSCCLFVSGRTVVYRSHYIRPQFPPKVDFGGLSYRLQASHVASHVDWPSSTLLTVRPARQYGVQPRRMTTIELIGCWVNNSQSFHSIVLNQMNTCNYNGHEIVIVEYFFGDWGHSYLCLVARDKMSLLKLFFFQTFLFFFFGLFIF